MSRTVAISDGHVARAEALAKSIGDELKLPDAAGRRRGMNAATVIRMCLALGLRQLELRDPEIESEAS